MESISFLEIVTVFLLLMTLVGIVCMIQTLVRIEKFLIMVANSIVVLSENSTETKCEIYGILGDILDRLKKLSDVQEKRVCDEHLKKDL